MICIPSVRSSRVLFPYIQRPHYTIVKGCDHKIVRAFETHPKAVLWIIEIELCVVFKRSVKIYATGLSTECYFITILFMWAFLHNNL